VNARIDESGELAGQVFDMDSRPSVDLRRVLTRQKARNEITP
jgi:hypothetical protein